jgi:hypothetical protein
MTSATFNSTGNTNIAVFVKHEGATTTATVSDNKGTTWQAGLTKQGNGVSDSWGQWFYGKIGSPGTGHTVSLTLSAARDFRQFVVYLINSTAGDIAVEDQKTATGSTTTPTAGTITTSVATVTLVGVAEYAAVIYTAGTGFTEDFDENGPNYTYGESRADASGTSFSATCTANGSMDWACCAVAFKEATAGDTLMGQAAL